MAIGRPRTTYIREQLVALDSGRRLVFGALCCERLLPNYISFQRDSGWGDFAAVRKALDCVWAHVYGNAQQDAEIVDASSACELAAPSSDDFTSIYVTAAQDACFAVCSLLDYVLENDIDKIVQAATYATDSVDLFVQETNGIVPGDPELEAKILRHPLMQRELERQGSDLEAIRSAQAMSRDFIGERKAMNGYGEIGNLNLPMINTAEKYQFNAQHIAVDTDGSAVVIGFADNEFSPSRFVLIQKSLKVDERDRAIEFEKIHIQIEDESRSGYGGIVEVSAGHDRLTVFLDQAARAALKIDGDIEISVDPHHPVLGRAVSELKTLCEEGGIPFIG